MIELVNMEIRFLGNQTIYIKGKKESVLVNPTEQTGSSKLVGRIVAFTNKDFDSMGLSIEKVILRGPGEYEIGGVEVQGVNGGNGDSIYVFTIDGVTVGVLGELKEALSDKKQEKISSLDVMLISIKKNESISDKLILDWAKKWGANYLIPVGFDEPNEDLARFLDKADQEGKEGIDSLKVEKDELPDGMEVVVLKKS